MATRHFRNISGLTIHYREKRNFLAIPVVMLTSIPQCSSVLEPLMEVLGTDFRAVAPDMPGCNPSEAGRLLQPTMTSYLSLYRQVINALLGKRFMLYGRNTAAQFAMAFASAYPEQVLHLFLDDVFFFDDEDRGQILSKCQFDLSPRLDGGHLSEAWRVGKQFLRFFPWFESDCAHEYRQSQPTAAQIDLISRAFLESGSHFADSCRVAFNHARVENLTTLTVPATVFRRKGSYFAQFIDQIPPHSIPSNIVVSELNEHEDIANHQILNAMRAARALLLRDCFPVPVC